MALGGYFDETGVQKGAHATLVAGFVGDADAFDAAESEWQRILDNEEVVPNHFHYSRMVNNWKPFESMSEALRQRLFPQLADVIAGAVPHLRIASVGYHGVWPPPVNAELFHKSCPTSYSFCFQFMLEVLNEWAENKLKDTIVPVFAQHEQYAPSALALWNFVRPTNSWQHLGPIAFDDPRSRPSLQMADMILYELYQFLKGPHIDWRDWPLLSRLWKDPETLESATLFNVTHDERTIVRMLARGPRPWVPGGLSDPITDEELAERGEK